MNREEIEKFLVEQGVPEDKITELAEIFEQAGNRTHENMGSEPIEISPGVYLTHIMQNEPDWKKRAQLVAAAMSRDLS